MISIKVMRRKKFLNIAAVIADERAGYMVEETCRGNQAVSAWRASRPINNSRSLAEGGLSKQTRSHTIINTFERHEETGKEDICMHNHKRG